MLTLAEYRALVERAPMLIWRAGTDALCDYFNEGWLEFTGRTLAQEVGDGWAEGVHPDDLARCVSIYREHFGRRAAFEMEYRLRRHDGAWRWITDRGTPFFDEGGAFAGYIGSCVDVTDRVEAQAAEHARREAEIQRLSRLLPLCAWCKKLRTDSGYWQEIEGYLRESGLARVTHGICEDCARAVDWGDAGDAPP